MSTFVRHFQWVMLVAGLLTCTMFYAAFAPIPMQQSTFGDSVEGPVAEVVVRSWGILIGLVGLMLIYGAFDVASRRLALLVAAASKIAFISLVLVFGQHFLEHQVGTSVIVDSIMVALFVVYLIAVPLRAKARHGVANTAAS
jgi:hypothetical protein